MSVPKESVIESYYSSANETSSSRKPCMYCRGLGRMCTSVSWGANGQISQRDFEICQWCGGAGSVLAENAFSKGVPSAVSVGPYAMPLRNSAGIEIGSVEEMSALDDGSLSVRFAVTDEGARQIAGKVGMTVEQAGGALSTMMPKLDSVTARMAVREGCQEIIDQARRFHQREFIRRRSVPKLDGSFAVEPER